MAEEKDFYYYFIVVILLRHGHLTGGFQAGNDRQRRGRQFEAAVRGGSSRKSLLTQTGGACMDGTPSRGSCPRSCADGISAQESPGWDPVVPSCSRYCGVRTLHLPKSPD